MRASIAALVFAIAACSGDGANTEDSTPTDDAGTGGTSPTGDTAAPSTAGTEAGGSSGEHDAGMSTDDDDDDDDDTVDADTVDDTDETSGDTGEPAGVPLWLGVGNWGYRSWSSDGVTWQTEQNRATPSDHSPDLLRDVAWGNGYFVAVGGDQNSMVMRSADGASWEEDLHPAGAGQWMGAVAYGAGRWVAVGGVGRVMISDDDGATWIDNDATLPSAGRGVAYAEGHYVAVGDGGLVAVSSDGVSWDDHTRPDSVGLGGVAFGHGTWVVLGSSWNGSGFDTNCFASTDTTTWSPCPFSSARYDGIVYTDGRLIVAVQDGYEASDDGQTWTHGDVDVPAQAFRGGDLWVGAQSEQRFSGDTLETLVQTETAERGFNGFAMGWVAAG